MAELPRIDFYFDVISPYSYIGFEALQQLEHQWKSVAVRYIPFSLPQVMRETGNRPPALLAVRSQMLLTDLVRTAKFWGVPLTPLTPTLFMEWVMKYPTNDALKVLLVLEERNYDLMMRGAREMWLRLWSRNEKIFEEQDFREILKTCGVEDVDAVIQKSKEPEYEELLKANTQQAIGSSAYGAPWVKVYTKDGEEHSFFGSDRFNLIAELLDQPQPLPKRLLSKN